MTKTQAVQIYGEHDQFAPLRPLIELVSQRACNVDIYPRSMMRSQERYNYIAENAILHVLNIAEASNITAYIVGSQANAFGNKETGDYDPRNHDIDIQLIDTTQMIEDPQSSVLKYISTLTEVNINVSQGRIQEYDRNTKYYIDETFDPMRNTNVRIVIIANIDQNNQLINLKLSPAVVSYKNDRYIINSIVADNKPLIEIGFPPEVGINSLDFDPTQQKIVKLTRDGYEVIERDSPIGLSELTSICERYPVTGIVMMLRGLNTKIFSLSEVVAVIPTFPFNESPSNVRQFYVYVRPLLLRWISHNFEKVVAKDDETIRLLRKIAPAFLSFLDNRMYSVTGSTIAEDIRKLNGRNLTIKQKIIVVIFTSYKNHFCQTPSEIPQLETIARELSISLGHKANLEKSIM